MYSENEALFTAKELKYRARNRCADLSFIAFIENFNAIIPAIIKQYSNSPTKIASLL